MYRQVWNPENKRWGWPKKLGVRVTNDNRHLYEFLYGKLYKNPWYAYRHMLRENKALDEAKR
jgi:hypothetical protein